MLNCCILLSTIISICLQVCSSKRTCFDQIDIHVGQSSRQEYSYIQDHKRKRYVYTDRNQKSMSTKMRRKEIQTEPINVNSMQQL